jgi:hypothetical protein
VKSLRSEKAAFSGLRASPGVTKKDVTLTPTYLYKFLHSFAYL